MLPENQSYSKSGFDEPKEGEYNPQNEIILLSKRIRKLKNEYSSLKTKLEKKQDKMEGLLFYGFIVLLVMIAGLIFAYWEFTATNKIYYDENLKNQTNFIQLNSDFKTFKDCLSSGGWTRCFK